MLMRVKRTLLEGFSRLPLDDLPEGSPAGSAVSFGRCVTGAMTVPWSYVAARVDVGGVGDAAREAMLRSAT